MRRRTLERHARGALLERTFASCRPRLARRRPPRCLLRLPFAPLQLALMRRRVLLFDSKSSETTPERLALADEAVGAVDLRLALVLRPAKFRSLPLKRAARFSTAPSVPSVDRNRLRVILCCLGDTDLNFTRYRTTTRRAEIEVK